ncbi:MAG: DUF448 domain-containing protein [Epsilonproteobacteria bacterium]|nr:DUF448 domain-containing protein [Campylobacterota bacterium]
MKIRMCVVCRGRFHQDTLNRYQCKNGEMVEFSGVGRSFYVCNGCINSKKLAKILKKICR